MMRYDTGTNHHSMHSPKSAKKLSKANHQLFRFNLFTVITIVYATGPTESHHRSSQSHIQRRSVGYRRPGRTAISPPPKVVTREMPMPNASR